MINRRNFIVHTALASAGTLICKSAFSQSGDTIKFNKIKIGICADIHLDTVYDGTQRLEAFIQKMENEQPDFIIQLGDFCSPLERNLPFRIIWNRFSRPKYDVIGNHDTDGDFTRSQVASFMKMPGCYYSFDLKGYHFIVLDSNEVEYNTSRNPLFKYSSFISDRQLDWLEADMEKAEFPIIIFLHHGLDNNIGGVENAVKVRALLDRHNQKEKASKVLLVFSGHHHQDYHNVINDIHYIQINSMSYQWLGKPYEHVPYTEEVNQKYPWTKYTAPYKEPLWATVDISSSGIFKLTGKASEFVGQSPEELGREKYPNGYPEVPYISNRQIKLMV